MGLGKRGRLRVDQPTITGELGPAPDAYTHYSPVMIAALSKTAGRSAFDEGGPFFLRQAGGRERAQSHGRRRQHLSACSRGSEPDREQRGSVTPAASNHLDQVFQSSSRSSENFNKSDALVMRLLPETSLGLQTGKSCSEQRRTTLNPAQLPSPALEACHCGVSALRGIPRAHRPADSGLCCRTVVARPPPRASSR